MTKEFEIAGLSVHLSYEQLGVRVKSKDYNANAILPSQNVENVYELISNNFRVVSHHYNTVINKSAEEFDLTDIYKISFSIVMSYLYMYNFWRSHYKNQKNKDLNFDVNDFNHPSTHDIIFNYYKDRYPSGWETKCAILIEMGPQEFKEYHKRREDYYNK